jgi:small-conductance mechanosensitive channel
MDIRSKNKKPEEEQLSEPRSKTGVVTYIGLAVIFIAVYIFTQFYSLGFLEKHRIRIGRISLGLFWSAIILFISKLIELFIHKNSESKSDKYNLIRVIRLICILLICIVIVSFVFVNWYTAAVSLGLLSLILGFALQTPISSFIGWINILLRKTYHIGDRIQINDFKGDVVEINYFDTTLWEFAGDYLTNDVPSGRLIRFPNSLVFQYAVFNYSWKKFPYIWNEIPIHVAYESDLDFIGGIMKEIADKELDAKIKENIQEYKELLKATPVDELNVKDYPFVSYRINANTWVEVTLTYLVEPKHASTIRTVLIKKILEALTKQPDKALLPKSNSR